MVSWKGEKVAGWEDKPENHRVGPGREERKKEDMTGIVCKRKETELPQHMPGYSSVKGIFSVSIFEKSLMAIGIFAGGNR